MVKVVEKKEEFDKAIAENKLVVVDFYADWCGPCKAIAPKFEEFSNKYTNVVFLKVNVDDLDDVAQSCGISALPTFQFYCNGEKVDELQGASEKKLGEMLEKYKT